MFQKLLSLALLTALCATCGCNSRQAAQSAAVSDAEKVVAFYLPKLLNDPALKTDQVFKLPATPVLPGMASEQLRTKRAQEASRFQEQYLAALRAIGGQEFRGLTATGKSFSGPGYGNITGSYYLDARRNAVFGLTTIPVSLLVMHPDNFDTFLDPGVEIVNDPLATGVDGVGKLKFLLAGMGLAITNKPLKEGSPAAAKPQFEIRGRLRVFVSHSGVRK